MEDDKRFFVTVSDVVMLEGSLNLKAVSADESLYSPRCYNFHKMSCFFWYALC